MSPLTSIRKSFKPDSFHWSSYFDTKVHGMMIEWGYVDKFNNFHHGRARSVALAEKDASLFGYRSAGAAKPQYCTQNDGQCQTCSLRNSVWDCQNQLIDNDLEGVEEINSLNDKKLE
ncbi:MAG: hypothetical protein WBM07_01510 [Chitinivibrionales bacterium]